jgi:hypothetical protein
MLRRHAVLVVSVLTVAACKDSTSPAPPVGLVTDAPALVGAMTIAGASSLSATGRVGLSSAFTGNPIFMLSSAALQAPPPTCLFSAVQGTPCTHTFNGLTLTYRFGERDSLGTRYESELTGTVPAAGGRPAMRLDRRAVSWIQSMFGGTGTSLSMRHRSNETGTNEQLSTPRVVLTDTGSIDMRIVLSTLGITQADRMPRMIGTSRRVIWTSRDGAPATFWRETTTYDSSTVIRSEIETPAGTRRCSIDLSAIVLALTCQ